eukprot:TRINITY_DN0_c598_g1_i1.p1 TRINITY_DN0_c598_g1~~TRINITY_DN0_c598_g1_i1.p1  ORF type:complete len:108 (+),score=45.27 TRINITY_DN0_c598_g1_i1:1-324(+)
MCIRDRRNTLIQNIQGGRGPGGNAFQVNNPYFNEQTMNFPIGTSVMLPPGALPGAGGQPFMGANIGGQFANSQYAPPGGMPGNQPPLFNPQQQQQGGQPNPWGGFLR